LRRTDQHAAPAVGADHAGTALGIYDRGHAWLSITSLVASGTGAGWSAYGKHGIKGAAHGIKGGRPRLDLTDEERKERRRQQHEAYRRRQGIPPKPPSSKPRPKNWVQEYFEIWGKPPGGPLTAEEFAEREPLWNAKVLKQQEADKLWEAEKQREKLERQKRRDERGRQRLTPPRSPVAATPSVGRNQPCPCGSGRKFKKCCGA